MRLFPVVAGLASAAVSIAWAASTEPVRVSLQTAFESPGLLAELIETAAAQNPDSFARLLVRLSEDEDDGSDGQTDEQLYRRFLALLREDPFFAHHGTDLFELVFAARTAAPRIAAHYHYFNSSRQPASGDGSVDCPSWVAVQAGRACSVGAFAATNLTAAAADTIKPFDRLVGTANAAHTVSFYTDLTMPSFGHFFRHFRPLIDDGDLAVQVRFVPPRRHPARPVQMQGYGVQMVAKKTDYLVMDDRAGSSSPSQQKQQPQAPTADQIDRLSIQAASKVLDAASPLDALLDLTQNMPAALAGLIESDPSDDLLDDLRKLPTKLEPGFNGLWANGLSVADADFDPFLVLKLLAKETGHAASLRRLGLSLDDAIELLAHPEINRPATRSGQARYHVLDSPESGGVVLWLNDLEKDEIYSSWPSSLGQLVAPHGNGKGGMVRRNIQSLVVPLDLSSRADIDTMFMLNTLIHRRMPLRVGMTAPRRTAIRIGIVPLVNSVPAVRMAGVAGPLAETYNSTVMLDFFDCFRRDEPGCFADHQVQSFAGRLVEAQAQADESVQYLEKCTAYNDRLALATDADDKIAFVNGVVVHQFKSKDKMIERLLSADQQAVRLAVARGVVDDSNWDPAFVLRDSLMFRDRVLAPENRADVRVVDLGRLDEDVSDMIDRLPRLGMRELSVSSASRQLIVVDDFDSLRGRQMVEAAVAHYRQPAQDRLEVVFLHSGRTTYGPFAGYSGVVSAADVESKMADQHPSTDNKPEWNAAPVLAALGLSFRSSGLVLNGRVVELTGRTDDAGMLISRLESVETVERLDPAFAGASALGLLPVDGRGWVRLCSAIAASSSSLPAYVSPVRSSFFNRLDKTVKSFFRVGDRSRALVNLTVFIDPLSEKAARLAGLIAALADVKTVSMTVFMNPQVQVRDLPPGRFYRFLLGSKPKFDRDGQLDVPAVSFDGLPAHTLFTMGIDGSNAWVVSAKESILDLDNISLPEKTEADKPGQDSVTAVYELEHILVQGQAVDENAGLSGAGTQVELVAPSPVGLSGRRRARPVAETIVMANLDYFQLKANPGYFVVALKPGASSTVYSIHPDGESSPAWSDGVVDGRGVGVAVMDFEGPTVQTVLRRNVGWEDAKVLEVADAKPDLRLRVESTVRNALVWLGLADESDEDGYLATTEKQADINIFSVASGHLYERMLNIMIVSVRRHTKPSTTIKFWLIDGFLSPSFKQLLPHMAAKYNFSYQLIGYSWPVWLRAQREKQRQIWGYKILFLDVLFPLGLDKVIFVDADQIVRTDMMELVNTDLKGAPYGFTPMCDSRTEMEGFRFWKTGYWKSFLKGRPYHISALYVVDLAKFRALRAGDWLRSQYQQLSSDPASLANLDQDLPNNMQFVLPIHSLDQNWLWCETWCSDESFGSAKTIDLCNNPLTKEPKLDRARRQIVEWNEYDGEVGRLASQVGMTGWGESVGEQTETVDERRDEL